MARGTARRPTSGRCAALLYDLCPNDPTALVRTGGGFEFRARAGGRSGRAGLFLSARAACFVNAAAPTVAADARHPAQLDASYPMADARVSQIRANATARRRPGPRARRRASRSTDGGPRRQRRRNVPRAIATAVAACVPTPSSSTARRSALRDDLARGTTLVVSVMEHEGDGAAGGVARVRRDGFSAARRLAFAATEADIAEDAARVITDAGSTLFLRAAAMACVRKASASPDWVALAEAVAAGIDTDGVEAARRAVFRAC